MDTTFIRIRDRSIALGVSVLTVAAFYFVYQSASDRRDLETVRHQNAILQREIHRLNESFALIRQYTNSADDLIEGGSDTQGLHQGDELQLTVPPDEAGSLFARMSLAARADRHGEPEVVSPLEAFTNMLGTLDKINRETDVVVRRLSSLATILKNDGRLMRSIPSRMPLEGGRVSSEFGWRLSPFEGRRHFHAGIDIAAPSGTTVHAPGDGKVTFVGEFDSLGKTIVVNHGNGMLTRYGHLSRTLVHKGMTVRRGQAIAHVGNTGRSTGPHLHYEVWVRNVAVNPQDFFFDILESPDVILTKASTPTRGRRLAAENLTGIGGN